MDKEPRRNLMKILRIIVVLLIVSILILFIYITAGKDPQTLLINTMKELDSRHFMLISFIFLLTLISTMTGLPVLYLAVALGFFFNFFPALVMAWVINLAAIMFTFWMVRTLFYDYFAKRYGGKKLIKKTNKRIRKYGLWTIAFSRSIYILPTNIINFSFPLSKIRPSTYLAGTMIGLLPECLINVSAGYMLRHEFLLLQSPRTELFEVLIVAGFMVLLATAFIILRLRQKKLRKTKIEQIVPLLREQ